MPRKSKRNDASVKNRSKKYIVIKSLLWLATAALLTVGVALDGRGIVSVLCLSASVLLGIVTVILSLRWDAVRYRSENDNNN